MTDFITVNYGSVWNIRAVSPSAVEFAEEHFVVDTWQGIPTNFTSDWRPVRDVAAELVDAGFVVQYKTA